MKASGTSRTHPAAVMSMRLLLLAAAVIGAQAQTYTVLHRFKGAPADGRDPYAAGAIRDSAGNLYGTTANGGASGYGIVYKLATTRKETVLHNFTGGAGGGNPSAGVISDLAGNLYGTANWGAHGQGVVYKIDTAGTYTVLYSFTGGANGGEGGGEIVPGLIRDAAGNLYGATVGGGGLACGGGCGVVFKVAPTGTETVLHSFTGADGQYPSSNLIRDPSGSLYGTANFGGLGFGVVFKVDKAGNATVLHSFTGSDGATPYAAGVSRDSAGSLYGTTYFGGAPNNGVVYKLDTAGTYTVLHSFTGGADGKYPYAGVIRDAAGNLYGTTTGGANSGCGGGCGVVFKIDPAGNYTVLYSFTGGADGGRPFSGLIRDPAGNLYGTDGSVVFKLTP